MYQTGLVLKQLYGNKNLSLFTSQIFYKGLLYTYQFNPLNTKRRLLYLKTQLVPRSKRF